MALALSAAACIFFFYTRGSGEQPICRAGFNNFPPYMQADMNGKPEGLAIELISRAAANAGVRLQWIRVPWTADEAFERNAVDVFPILAVTNARKTRLHLSYPWWENESALVSLDSARITTALGTAGKRIAARQGTVHGLARSLFPQATLLAIPDPAAMELALCSGNLEGYFVTLRVLHAQLLKRLPACSGRQLFVAPIPGSSAALATASSKQSAEVADRIYRELAHLALDGTLSEIAVRWGVTNAQQTRHMKQAQDAERRVDLLRIVLAVVTLGLIVTGFQTYRMRQARLGAESARREAEESRHKFDAFMDHTPAITFMKDEEGRIVYVNAAFCKQFETSLDRVLGKFDHEFWPRDVADQLRRNDMRVLAANESMQIIETVQYQSAEARQYLSLKFPFSNPRGDRFIGGVSIDITDSKRAEQDLRLSQFSIDQSPDMIFWLNSDGAVFYANNAASTQLGYTHEELLAKSIWDIDSDFTWETFVKNRREFKKSGSFTVESHHRARSGEMIPVEVGVNCLEFDGREFICWMSRDIAERKRAQGELSHQAQHDLLTGLANRRLFENSLERLLSNPRRDGGVLAVFYLDLDGFKLVNDSFGHGVGDAVLKHVSSRLQNCIREGDTLARVGGDEFTLIATCLGSIEDANRIGRKLLSNLTERFEVEGHEIRMTGSVGIGIFPRDGRDSGSLMHSADSAMYEAKRRGKNQVQSFTPEMGEAARERLELERHLQQALERDEFRLHFQPQISLASGKIIRYEALLRWNHPVLGLVPPAKFIPVAEDTGLMIPIGTWVLEEACRQACDWRLNEGIAAGVGVNVSMLQFVRPDFVETVIAALDRTGLSPWLLELELTESVVMQGLEEVTGKIATLRTLGISITIDDFGTGYSSLSYLQKLHVDSLKIDRSFVREIAVDANAASLTKALVSLSHTLGIRVVIEGIETEEQLKTVREMGCDMAQGFLLGRPSPSVSATVDIHPATPRTLCNRVPDLASELLTVAV